VAQAYNPSYLWDRDCEDHGLKPAYKKHSQWPLASYHFYTIKCFSINGWVQWSQLLRGAQMGGSQSRPT
jgi:hypothetical protein